ncbi:MAG TPA: hypothetical protein VFE60_17185 [Roseiarcus sp.]|nr:hypothetical protein [Roseiarcus sp.]
MIRLAISAEAFEAIAATMPLGNVNYERERAACGGYFIWLDPRTVDKLKAARQPSEGYSETIIRLATERR